MAPVHPYPFPYPSVRLAVVTRPRTDKHGTRPLFVRVAHADVDRYVALGIRVPLAEWDAKRGRVKGKHFNAQDLNEILADKLRDAERAASVVTAERGRYATADHYKEAVEAAVHPEPEAEPEAAPAPPPPVGVVEYGKRIEAEKRAAGKVGTSLVYGTAMNNLSATLMEVYGAPDLPVADVTADVVRAHERRLSTPEPVGLGQKTNYVNRQMRTLRTVLLRAAADGVDGAGAAASIVTGMRFKTERVQKLRLPIEDVRKLDAARAEGAGTEGPLTSREREVLDWWLLAFYVGGIRFGDVMALRWDSVERDADGKPVYVRWRMRKTGDAQGVPVLMQAAAILKDWEPRTGPGGASPSPYVFGMTTEAAVADPEALFRDTHRMSAIARKHLREIAKATGTAYVGFHGSRHSLADHLRKSGVPIATISQVLGHSSIAVTMAYLAGFDRQSVEDGLRTAFGDDAFG